MGLIPVVVDVWVASDPVVPAWHADVLDADERARAAALREPAASRFVLGRLVLRGALAGRLGCEPGEVVLTARCPRCGGAHGPVAVGRTGGEATGRDGDGARVHVSVTRSGPVVAVALSESGPVGIDAETRAAVDAAPLADVVLSRRELDRHRRWPHARSLARTWVRKEAALKALGVGLTLDPSSVALDRAPRATRGVVAVVGDSVAVADLRLGRGRAGAVAVVAPELVRPVAAPARARGTRRLLVRRYDGASALAPPRS